MNDLEKQAQRKNLFWDPFEEKIWKDKFKQENQNRVRDIEDIKNNPQKPKIIAFIITIPFISFCIFGGFLFLDLSIQTLPLLIITASLLLLLPTAYRKKIIKLQKDYFLMNIAQENNWNFSASKNYYRWHEAKSFFGDILWYGTQNQCFNREIWGKENQYNFWFGNFHFENLLIKVKNISFVSKHNKSVFAIHLPKKIKQKIKIESMHTISFFKKRTLKTESINFNKYFLLSGRDQKQKTHQEILEILTPALQVQLLEILKTEGPFDILFSKDTALFVFHKTILKKMKTNFFKSPKKQIEDKILFEKKIKNLLDIIKAIQPYLD
jgi:hypothetical protein